MGDIEILLGELSMDTKGPKVSIPTFSGRSDSKDFIEFVKEFNKVANALGWTEKRSCQIIGICFKGEASVIYEAVEDATKKNWRKLLEELAIKFRRSDSVHSNRFKLHAKKQLEEESVAEFASSIRNLVLRSFPSKSTSGVDLFSEEARRELEVHYFINGLKLALRAPLLRQQQSISTLEEGIELACQEETIQKVIKDAQIREINEKYVAQVVAGVNNQEDEVYDQEQWDEDEIGYDEYDQNWGYQ